MKIRTGFVSNSSSSSFVLYGSCLKIEELLGVLKVDEDEILEGYELFEECLNKLAPWLRSNNITCLGDEDYYYVYVGMYPEKFPDDEKTGVTKKNIEVLLKGMLGDKWRCGWQSGTASN